MNRRQVLIGGGAVVAGGAAVALGSKAMTGSSGEAAQVAETARRAMAVPPQDRDLIRYATLAANGHNTQPWRFKVRADAIAVLPDMTRRTPVVDPDDHHLFVSLGCAAENLSIAAAAAGLGGELDLRPDGSIIFVRGGASDPSGKLAGAIPHRQSTRSDYDGQALEPKVLRSLERAAAVPGVELVLITDRPSISTIGDLVLEGNRRQMTDKAFMDELKQWIRFSPKAAIRRGDGLFAAASGNPVVPDWLGRAMFPFVVTAEGENKRYAKQLASSSGLAVFFAETDDPRGWAAVGRACQRFQLQATTQGVRSAFVNQPVEVQTLRSELASAVGRSGKRPDLLLRFGRAPLMPYSLRRPINAVIV